jgi:hypothetical protein
MILHIPGTTHILLYQDSVWCCFGVSGLTVRWDDGNGFAFCFGSPLSVYQMYMWAEVAFSLCMFSCVSSGETALL